MERAAETADFDGGILSELIYADEPRIINDFHVAPDDPAAELLAGHGSLVAIPLLDQGVALNMVVHLRREPGAFDPELLPEHVWTANLFGRATNSLVLADTVKTAYEEIDRELKAVADHPAVAPAAGTSRGAVAQTGGALRNGPAGRRRLLRLHPAQDGLLGILIADVSGHGTPAAVMMAVMHSIVHNYPGDSACPPSQLSGLSQREARGRTMSATNGTFVTAFYGIYDPATRQLDVFLGRSQSAASCAAAATAKSSQLDGAQQLPLGVMAGIQFPDRAEPAYALATRSSFTPTGSPRRRLPRANFSARSGWMTCWPIAPPSRRRSSKSVLKQLDSHTERCRPDDDQTLVVAQRHLTRPPGPTWVSRQFTGLLLGSSRYCRSPNRFISTEVSSTSTARGSPSKSRAVPKREDCG